MKFYISECSCNSISIKQRNSESSPVQQIEEESICLTSVDIDTCVWDEIGFLFISSSSNADVSVKFETEEPMLISSFTLNGTSTSITAFAPDSAHVLDSGKHNLYFLPPTRIDSVLEKKYKGLIICLSNSFIQKLVTSDSEILNSIRKSAKSELTKPDGGVSISVLMYQLVQSIEQCSYKNYMKRIFMEAKVLELLFVQIEQLNSKNNKLQHSLKPHDVEKIHYAQKIIEENLQNPCSLIELAHKVGINDFKLKKGFKELLGNTVFGYLFDLRMEKAKHMLLDHKSVSEVAHEVGYKNPHHFTSAFKKKFGILPSDLNRIS